MHQKSKIRLSGRIVCRVFDENGKFLREWSHHNLLVTAGLQHIAALLEDATAPTEMSHMAIGSGTTAADAGDTTLETELGRVALTSRTRTGAQVEYVASFGAGVGTGTVTEAGIFNDASTGTLLCRSVFGAKTKAAGETFEFHWTITAADDGV